MVFKEVLLQLSTYPEACPTNAIGQAVEFSELLRARISALTFEIEFYMPGNVLANAILNVPGMIAKERTKNVYNVRNLITAFRTAATARNLEHHHIVERGMTSQIPEIVTIYARLYNLTILPMEAQSGFQHYVAECVIFGSGCGLDQGVDRGRGRLAGERRLVLARAAVDVDAEHAEARAP